MNGFAFACDYKDDASVRRSFSDLARHTFGIDFERWYARGCWDHRYICHSFLDEGSVVANVSVTAFDLVIDGAPVRAAQIGTVMTRPDLRRKGLGRALMERVVALYEGRFDLLYLFANEESQGFYSRFGFGPVSEFAYEVEVSGLTRSQGPIRTLNFSREEDLDLVRRLSGTRMPVSRVMGVERDSSILMWYIFNGFGNDFHVLPDLDAVVVFRRVGPRVDLFDVIVDADGRGYPDLREVLSRIGGGKEGTLGVVFRYTPDLAGIPVEARRSSPMDTMFVRSATVTLPERFLYPRIAHT